MAEQLSRSVVDKLRRFLGAYLAAAVMATVMALVIQSAYVLIWGLGTEAFHDFPSTAVFYSGYSLAFTLVLGLAGWSLLRVAGSTGWLPYAIMGAALGFLARGLYFPDGFELDNLFLTSFCVAGFAAALTFRAVYYRRRHPRASPDRSLTRGGGAKRHTQEAQPVRPGPSFLIA